MRSLKIVFIVANITFISAQAAEIVKLDNFQNESVEVPSPWRIIQLNKKIAPTLYKIKRWDDVLAIEATANNSMALLARPVEVDLKLTPVLCWRWRVAAPLSAADMSTKEGDDYAARVLSVSAATDSCIKRACVVSNSAMTSCSTSCRAVIHLPAFVVPVSATIMRVLSV